MTIKPTIDCYFFYIFNHGNRRLRKISQLIYKSADRPQRLRPNVSNILIGRHVELILLLPYLQVSCHDKWVFIRVQCTRGPEGGTEACVWTMENFAENGLRWDCFSSEEYLRVLPLMPLLCYMMDGFNRESFAIYRHLMYNLLRGGRFFYHFHS